MSCSINSHTCDNCGSHGVESTVSFTEGFHKEVECEDCGYSTVETGAKGVTNRVQILNPGKPI